ncbi:MAG: 6-bladed beta-propeller [Candidatus Aminicenantes bacterium]|nr:6-bladed beta-propeller [Candidatus Aminicenantes bacterium]
MEVDGVTVVRNPKEPMYGENVFSLEEEQSIGEAEGREEYMFSEIGTIAIDDEERIYISDWKETHIKVFDKDGMYLITIGRKGQGPGEFERISGMQITHQKELLVFDMNMRRLSFFTVDGKLIETLSISELRPFKLNMNSKRNFIITSVTLDLMNNQSITEFKIYDANLSLLKTIATPSPRNIFNPFDSFFIWELAKDDNIVYGYNETYELQILDSGGKIIEKIVKEYDPVKITKEEKQEAEKKYSSPNKIEYPQFRPAYQYFILDDDDRIYVQTFEKTEDGNGYFYDIFDSKGRYVAKIPLRFTPRILKKDKLYTIEEDEEGFQMVKRYKVTWRY